MPYISTITTPNGTQYELKAAGFSNLGDVGSEGRPIYINDGIPVAGTFSWGSDEDNNVTVSWDGDTPDIVIPTSTPLAINKGGTGASTANQARINLGMGGAATYDVVSMVQDDDNLVTNGAIKRYIDAIARNASRTPIDEPAASTETVEDIILKEALSVSDRDDGTFYNAWSWVNHYNGYALYFVKSHYADIEDEDVCNYHGIFITKNATGTDASVYPFVAYPADETKPFELTVKAVDITDFISTLSIAGLTLTKSSSTITAAQLKTALSLKSAAYVDTESTVANDAKLPTGAAVKSFVEGKGYVTTDTKNTAGSTDTSSKIFLIGATSQAANPQTYSDNEVYATSGVLTTKAVQVGGGSCTMQFNSTTNALDFIFS